MRPLTVSIPKKPAVSKVVPVADRAKPEDAVAKAQAPQAEAPKPARKIAFVTKTGKSVEFASNREAGNRRKRVPNNLEDRVRAWMDRRKGEGEKVRGKVSAAAMRRVRKGVRETGLRNLDFVLDQVYARRVPA
jgi:hypothetical protein